MGVKKVKGITPGRRQMSVSTFEEVTTSVPQKSLLVARNRLSGRNNSGKITIRHRGGGAKRHYRMIDFKQHDQIGIEGVVKSIEYDPNRNAYIMLVFYANGEKRYHLAPQGIKVNDKIMTAERAKIKVGNRLHIGNIPTGFTLHNIELRVGRGGQIVRSAGGGAKLISLEGDMAQVELPSKEVRFIPKNTYASIGSVSNPDHSNINWGKAGRTRWKGRRPQVRGKVMNPVDHPHGGGEGRNQIGLKYPKTPWGLPALGVKTRKRKNPNNIFRIRDRRGKNFIKVD
jgi:large subunit ribosomal protein L2